MVDDNGLRLLLPERINGSRKTSKGVYVPHQEEIRKILSRMVPKAEDLPEYVPQGNELKVIEVARANRKAVLLSGPTGVGKTLLASYYSAKNGLPFLLFSASEDATDWSMRGAFGFLMAPLVDDRGGMHDAKFQMFAPAQIALAAMADVPVVLFIDELHKLRAGAATILHGLTNPTERTLYAYDLCGENYPLHPETLVLAAVNPSYGQGGIENLDAALRRRFSTVDLKMPGKEKIKEIVYSNVGVVTHGMGLLIDKLADVQTGIALARSDDEGKGGPHLDGGALLDSAALASIIEAPSPASIVETVKDILKGLPVMDAIAVNMINTIVTDFGVPRTALINYVRDKIPESLINSVDG